MLKRWDGRLFRLLIHGPVQVRALLAPAALVVVAFALVLGYYTRSLPATDPNPAVGTLLVVLTFLALLMLRSLYRMSRTNAALRDAVTRQEISLQETHHRIKNNLALISSLISLEQYGEPSDSETERLALVRERVHAVSELHATLLEASEYRRVAMDRYLRKIVDGLRSGVTTAPLCLDVSADIELPGSKAISCGLIVTELVTNAVKHVAGDRNREIRISLGDKDEGQLELSVCDAGRGFGAPDTVARAESSGQAGTRGREPPGGGKRRRNGRGTAIVDALVEQLRGSISRTDVDDCHSGGARVTVRFPKNGERVTT